MDKKLLSIMALALALPSTVLGVFFLLKELVENKILNELAALIILLIVIIHIFYLILKQSLKKND